MQRLDSTPKDANEIVSKISFNSLTDILNSDKKEKKSDNQQNDSLVDNHLSFNASEDIKNGKIIRERYKREADECESSKNFQQKKQVFMNSFNFIVKTVQQQCLELFAKKRHII